ncbi:DUF624 domain-containing protein [Curtobacterium ammoniigenes]|uniref:DUF624 domain-containing protein n=1 Tax=Curtobacterium ammoniigenes TaxID=395387 RepID=UPI000831D563|nr:DUF624 domain-containing protein [Curtobacterium ammoniigenes]
MTIEQRAEGRGAERRGGNGIGHIAYWLCGEIGWMGGLNAAWILGTLLGGVVLGVGPATAAAFALARRHQRGDGIRLIRDFWRAYRSQWRHANAVFGPVAAVGASLAFTWSWVLQIGAPIAGIVVLVPISALFVAVASVVGPMQSHYVLPWFRYVPVAVRFVLSMPWAIGLLGALVVVVALASIAVPALPVFLTIGAWIQLDAVLCMAMFTANDSRQTTVPEPPSGS